MILDNIGVEHLTIDAVMYTLAILRNFKYCGFKGTFPKNLKARSVLRESGFLNYVQTYNGEAFLPDTNQIQIRTGYEVDSKMAQEIRNFASKDLPKEQRTSHLYEMLIELMANTKNHAYDKDEILWDKSWYIYAKKENEKVSFTFLDTGDGIPSTVHKNYFERAKDLIVNSEVSYIVSALVGEVARSQTKQGNRGNGLPEIYNLNKVGKITKLSIISGKGYYISGEAEDNLSESFDGTIVYWEISKLEKEAS